MAEPEESPVPVTLSLRIQSELEENPTLAWDQALNKIREEEEKE